LAEFAGVSSVNNPDIKYGPAIGYGIASVVKHTPRSIVSVGRGGYLGQSL